eukprot:scaffold191350_cov12-Tisochrysis_lutea.AAC.1
MIASISSSRPFFLRDSRGGGAPTSNVCFTAVPVNEEKKEWHAPRASRPVSSSARRASRGK